MSAPINGRYERRIDWSARPSNQRTAYGDPAALTRLRVQQMWRELDREETFRRGVALLVAEIQAAQQMEAERQARLRGGFCG